MIEAIAQGRLHGAAQQRESKTGQRYTTGTMRAGTAGDACFLNLIVFDESTQQMLLALSQGDALVVAGSLTPKAWVDRAGNARPSLDMTVAQVMTPYALKQKRERAAAAKPRPDFEAAMQF